MEELLTVYAEGICACSVCTNVKDPKRVEELVNQKNPTGISSLWRVSENTHFQTGETNPCPCNMEPDGFIHYLLEC